MYDANLIYFIYCVNISAFDIYKVEMKKYKWKRNIYIHKIIIYQLNWTSKGEYHRIKKKMEGKKNVVGRIKFSFIFVKLELVDVKEE